MVTASLRKLLEELHLVILLNPVQLTELVQFGHQRVNHLHAFEKFCTAFLVTSVLLTLSRAVFALEVRKLVLEGRHIPLLRSQLHHFLFHLIQKSVLVTLVHYRGLSCLENAFIMIRRGDTLCYDLQYGWCIHKLILLLSSRMSVVFLKFIISLFQPSNT